MADEPAPGSGENYTPDPDKTPQTNTPKQNEEQPTLQQNIVLTQEQFNALISRLDAGTVTDKTPAPSMTPGVGLRTNMLGQVVGTVQKYPIDPSYYPSPIEAILDEFDQDRRMRRFNLRENYFITFDMTAKPYETKDGLSTQEPTFHVTLYENLFDDDGEEIDKSIVIQTMHFNEDIELATLYAAEHEIEMSEETLRQVMDHTRHERIKRWLLAIFFPQRNFQLSIDAHEEAIAGTVVKVVTKSNVKGFGNKAPKVKDEELI
jgi:hypothetical protein